MILHSLKTALRNMLRHKLNTFIIIMSLTVAFCFSNILLAFIVHERSTDDFHHKKDRIYRLFSDDPFEKEGQIRFITREAMNFIQDHFPEVEASTLIAEFTNKGVGKDKDSFQKLTVLAADTTFFNLFDYPILEGNPQTAIQPGGLVLTQSAAKNLLGQPPYLGETVEVALDSGSQLLKVTGVVASLSENSQINFDALIQSNYIGNQWGGPAFLLLQPNADPDALVKKINSNKEVPSLIRPGAVNYQISLLQDSYFSEIKPLWYEQSRSELLVWICLMVVFLISFAASFNFINLFIIGLMGRKKEMGVRKVLGASKGAIGLGFGVEVSLYILVSLLLSLIITVQLLPVFNLSFNAAITTAYLFHNKVMLMIGGLLLVLGLLITLYLIYFSWQLNPIRLLNNNVSEKIRINRFLIAAQFFITIGMMICAMVVIEQMQYIKNKPLGFNRHMLQIDPPNEDGLQNLPALKQKLLQYPEFSSVALSLGNPISGNAIVAFELEDSTIYGCYLLSGDFDLVKTMHLEIVEGQSFAPGLKNGKLVNETLVRHFNMKNPIGATLPGTEKNEDGPDKIIGVVKDFNVVSFKKEIPPYMISYNEHPNHLLVDISGKQLSTVLPLLEKSWKEIFPDFSFNYKLINDELMRKHQDDMLFFRMIISFTIASVLISCFGLFGIAAFSAVQRTKEIGIRKVLGASISSILVLLSKDFVKLLLVAFVLAIPVANYFMSEWLQEFAFRIQMQWWLFALPGLAVLLIALLSVSGQSWRAARRNPVDSLRNE